ncbi:oleandolide olivosyltransferase OleG2 [Streptomyces sp. NBRC 110028]|uniref:oleandolide olivosyltransferase OleG2 n=1 Tax=Streptomyces sp. NBRC 110028 TaxID=1621260 RepID=UPI0006E39ECB|nr:oleandolide olivosyltransferase OleG2 [Streptomyces sp. NBRC 110028]
MRVLLTCFANDTHFHGLVPLAWALRAAGHEVRVASQPALSDTITQAGLTAVPVGRDTAFLELMGEIGADVQKYSTGIDLGVRAELASWDYLLGMHTTLVPTFYSLVNDEPFVDGLVALARAWRPDLILWEHFSFAGALAARATGTPHARVLWGSDLIVRFRRDFLAERANRPAEHREDPMAEWLSWAAERLGSTFDEDLVTGQWTIDPLPRSMRLPTGTTTVPMRYVPYNGRAVVPAWVRRRARRPRICLTLGVSARQTLGDGVSLAEVLAALGDVDAEIVATLDASQRKLLGPVPDNVRLVDFVPLHALMPTCSAIVHHGGAGTWLTAAAHGVPQIVLGDLWDNLLRARQTQAAGAGLFIHPSEVTAAGLGEGVRRVLTDPSIRAAAQRVRDEMNAEPSPGEVVPVLERLAASGGRGRGGGTHAG